MTVWWIARAFFKVRSIHKEMYKRISDGDILLKQAEADH
jgi:hypothetical protein